MPVLYPCEDLPASWRLACRVRAGLFHPIGSQQKSYSLDDSPGESTQLDPISDRQLLDLIVSQIPLRLFSLPRLVLWLPDVHPRRLRLWFRMAR
jgi:hypothetical protein